MHYQGDPWIANFTAIEHRLQQTKKHSLRSKWRRYSFPLVRKSHLSVIIDHKSIQILRCRAIFQLLIVHYKLTIQILKLTSSLQTQRVQWRHKHRKVQWFQLTKKEEIQLMHIPCRTFLHYDLIRARQFSAVQVNLCNYRTSIQRL